ncbi:MAG: hypothetical protein PHW10_02595 [Candidatus Peribacteraceae bacterium]|nr:hypothetical protein [Candidatus Peribacteraceae bacterium]
MLRFRNNGGFLRGIFHPGELWTAALAWVIVALVAMLVANVLAAGV